MPPSDWFPEMECPKSSKIHLTIKTYMVLGCHHFRNPPIVSAWVYYSLQLQFYPPSSWGKKKTTPIISAWADYFVFYHHSNWVKQKQLIIFIKYIIYNKLFCLTQLLLYRNPPTISMGLSFLSTTVLSTIVRFKNQLSYITIKP